jgi:phosphate/sulfate permease
VIIVILGLLAVSDLIVGISNDAVNFLNSAVGSKAAPIRTIFIVAALGILFGCTFSSGMMEVARKGIFHPGLFYFSEIILIFLAVMVTDVILLDTFNTLGLPTSTTVSIVFELLGAAVGLSVIKVLTDPNALELASYINSGKALAIISGILLSVVIAFTSGVIIQFLSRILFSFDYKSRIRHFGALWGGMSISAITYFILIKGAKGASFMSSSTVDYIQDNTWMIIFGSFAIWALILQLLIWFSKVNIFKLIVLVGTFALAMAFAGNDLVNFIGVPLAGYNAYELYLASGAGADEFLMSGLAGKVKTPTLFLLLSGLIMTITLWKSRKAKMVLQTSIDLGRQAEGSERFASYAVSRSLVRSFSKLNKVVSTNLPKGFINGIKKQFDYDHFSEHNKIKSGENDASFDLIRAAVTLMVASILIALGTSLKLPLSTTYVTFMVFMGTSLADGAWGRESAVYRVSGVLSVVGGWFFTAFSAFTVALVIVVLFYYGGVIAIVVILMIAAYLVYRTHIIGHNENSEDTRFEKTLIGGRMTQKDLVDLSYKNMQISLEEFTEILDKNIIALEKEDLPTLVKINKQLKLALKKTSELQLSANKGLDKIEDDEIESAHMYILIAEYLNEIGQNVSSIVRSTLNHVDNNHKPYIQEQIDELKELNGQLKEIISSVLNVFHTLDKEKTQSAMDFFPPFVQYIRSLRKKQIKRIKANVIGTRNSMLYLNHLAEYRNIALFTSRIVQVCYDLVINHSGESAAENNPEIDL